jgi:ornithine cyclodeaminase/alanine dehydrogenase-like protein (mu-crystallin family)
MMRYLSNDDVRALVSADEAREVIHELFRHESEGAAENHPTTELTIPGGMFRIKAGVAYGYRVFGYKAYGGIGRASRYLVHVFSLETGKQLGILDSRQLTEIRTGAVSGVGTDLMARKDASVVGMIGTGREAREQILAVSRVRPLRQVRCWSRSEENRASYARDVGEKLGVEVVPTATPSECVRDADIVVTITSAKDPIVDGDWLSPGTFICGVGATTPERRELHGNAVDRCGTIVVEHLPQAQGESGELLDAVERGALSWDRVHELKDIVSGKIPGRVSESEINLFDTIGVGTEDIAIAKFALDKAERLNAGREIDL